MKKSRGDSSSPKLDRKTVEKNRRNHMKGLHFKLASLISPHHFKSSNKEMLSQHAQLDVAVSYIKQLKERIEKLNEIKEQAGRSSRGTDNSTSMDNMLVGLRLPIVELKDLGSTIEVVVVSGLNKNFMLYEVISILQEEGADVVSASYANLGDKLVHTIHAQVRICRVGVETTRVYERIQELIN
uniref:Uncharacterized protein LOC105128559 n=1 Tax=Rhizophora mucronata TaxID=61149 RepID=A0A2P2JK19_RHIMU